MVIIFNFSYTSSKCKCGSKILHSHYTQSLCFVFLKSYLLNLLLTKNCKDVVSGLFILLQWNIYFSSCQHNMVLVFRILYSILISNGVVWLFLLKIIMSISGCFIFQSTKLLFPFLLSLLVGLYNCLAWPQVWQGLFLLTFCLSIWLDFIDRTLTGTRWAKASGMLAKLTSFSCNPNMIMKRQHSGLPSSQGSSLDGLKKVNKGCPS